MRYQLKRLDEAGEDGRRDRPFKTEAVAEVIHAWHDDRRGDERPINVRELFEYLVEEHAYRQ